MAALAAQLSPNDHFSARRLIALTAIAITAWFYVILLIRAQRREKQNPTPSQTQTVTLWKVEFHELDHLPVPDRERLLRGVLENSEVKTFENRTRKLIGIIFYATMAILILVSITTTLPACLIVSSVTIWLLVACASTILIRIKIETKIVRRLLKQNLTSFDISSGSQT